MTERTEKDRAWMREYMRKRRADPEYRKAELERNRLLDKRPESQKKHADTTRARNRKRKAMGIEYLGGKCMKCGETFHPAVYEFHHRNPEEKEMTPTAAIGMSWENFKKELDKCDLLCANCHRLTHHEYEII